jgi:GNAT superfamily N-acetyltransferase
MKTECPIINKFVESLPKYNLLLCDTFSPDALQCGGNIYPTIMNFDKSVKVGIDRTDIYEYKREVWTGDPAQPLIGALVLTAIVTVPKERGKGKASNVLNAICAAADEAGLTLKLEAIVIPAFAAGGRALTLDAIMAWYERYGFVKIANEMNLYARKAKKPPVQESQATAENIDLRERFRKSTGHGCTMDRRRECDDERVFKPEYVEWLEAQLIKVIKHFKLG